MDYLKAFVKINGYDLSDEDLEEKLNQCKINHLEKQLLAIETEEHLTIEDIDTLSGIDFEMVVKAIFEKMGYSVSTTQITHDQGADLIVKGFNEVIVIQTKKYSNTIGNRAIQEVVASIKHYNANRGMVITNSSFSLSAIQLADSNNIELWDRNILAKQIQKYNINREDYLE